MERHVVVSIYHGEHGIAYIIFISYYWSWEKVVISLHEFELINESVMQAVGIKNSLQ